jgi:hypothetical protein
MEKLSSVSAIPIVTAIQNSAFSRKPIPSLPVPPLIESVGDD